MPDRSEIVLYTTPDGRHRLQVRIQDDNVWLTQKLMGELFQVTTATINEHLKNIFQEAELVEEAVIRNFRITAADGKRYLTKHYSLDAIFAVGFRVRSHVGTQFRQWAIDRLREYAIKGFTLDDERLQEPGGLDYFDELLQRVRAIRASEKRFYRKVTDIYALSVDYDPNNLMSREFFATVQNKLHYAVHGQTAGEVIRDRCDPDRPQMGLTTWRGADRGRTFTREDARIAKNYLTAEELDVLNRIVNQYLEFAELQAKSRKPMTMADWKAKLDAFLALNDREILADAGTVSAELARQIADASFEAHQARLHAVEADQEAVLEDAVRRLPGPRGKKEDV
jgi:hypothetical protein